MISQVQCRKRCVTSEIPTIGAFLSVLEADCVGELECDCCTACFGTASPSTDAYYATALPMPPSSAPVHPTLKFSTSPPSSAPVATANVYTVLTSTSRMGGLEFSDPESYQATALLWLVKSQNLSHMDDKRILQRFALACIFFSTSSVSNPHTDTIFGVGVSPPRWVKSNSWVTETDECLWYGITCDTEGRVISIDLSTNGLTGQFPPEVAYLKESLNKLNLFNNTVHSSVDADLSYLGELTNLVYLILSETFIESDGIPSEIGQLTNLIELDCSGAPFHGELRAQPLANLHALESLSASDSGLSGSIPSELGQLSALQQVWLSSNDLVGTVPSELGNLINLSEF